MAQEKKGLGQGKRAADEGAQPGARHKAIEQVLLDMQVKLQELDTIREELHKEQFTGITPQKSKEMLEELVIPSLELIRDEKKATAKSH